MRNLRQLLGVLPITWLFKDAATSGRVHLLSMALMALRDRRTYWDPMLRE